MSLVWLALACLATVWLVLPGIAAEGARGTVVQVPTIASYRDFLSTTPMGLTRTNA